jgi:Anti-sigma-K factor rskA
MIDHDEARELLEIAAVQPGGLDRLAAGDTAESATLAGHLAGCPSCSAEAERLRTSAGLIREAILETPPPELRERTLALVRAVGRPRGAAALASALAPRGVEPMRSAIPLARRRSFRAIALPLGIAAAIVLAMAGTAAFVANRSNPALATSQATASELARVTSWTLRVEAEPDVKRVALVGPSGSQSNGMLLFSPTTTDLVVVASGLSPAPTGQEYRCWVLLNGTRLDVGRMDLGAGLAYWVGPVPGLVQLPAGTPFGVSLATINGAISPGDPVISGSVGG